MDERVHAAGRIPILTARRRVEAEPLPRTVINGETVLVMERKPPLPPKLPALLARLRVYPIRITGWRSDCEGQVHRLMLLADGRYTGPDGITRELRVDQCADCEAVVVRDVSFDSLSMIPDQHGRMRPAARPAALAPRRRNAVLGWYTGARRNQREYRRL